MPINNNVLTAESTSSLATEVHNDEDNAMPPEARRALVSLLRYGVILFAQKAKLFESLCRHQDAVRKHLAEVYLKLVLDEKTGVAFVASTRDEAHDAGTASDDEVVSLISRRTLSLYDTLLLLVLRQHYQDRETAGEQKIIIDTERVASYLTPFLPLLNSTQAQRRKLEPALKRMVEKRLLRKVVGSDDRYEITPVIRYVVNAEFLETMLAEYRKLASEQNIELHNTDAVNGDDNV